MTGPYLFYNFYYSCLASVGEQLPVSALQQGEYGQQQHEQARRVHTPHRAQKLSRKRGRGLESDQGRVEFRIPTAGDDFKTFWENV